MPALACLFAVLAPLPPAPYHPTAIGTKWTYKYPDASVDYVVTAVESKGGEAVVLVGKVGADGGAVPQHRLAVSSDGVSKLGGVVVTLRMPDVLPAAGGRWAPVSSSEEWCDTQPRLRLLDATAKPGQSWKLERTSLPPTTYTAVAAARVTVPAGTFDALVVDSEVELGKGRTLRYRHWHVRGMGAVKWTIDDGRGVKEVVMTAFTPAK